MESLRDVYGGVPAHEVGRRSHHRERDERRTHDHALCSVEPGGSDACVSASAVTISDISEHSVRVPAAARPPAGSALVPRSFCAQDHAAPSDEHASRAGLGFGRFRVGLFR